MKTPIRLLVLAIVAASAGCVTADLSRDSAKTRRAAKNGAGARPAIRRFVHHFTIRGSIEDSLSGR